MKNKQILIEGSVLKALSSIAVPMFIMMFTAICFSWLDAWYIAKLGDAELTAIDISFPLITFSSSIIYGGLGTGVSAAIAAYSSSDKHSHTATGLKFGIWLSIVISAIISLLVIIGGRQLLEQQLMNHPEIIELSYTYCFWYFLPFPIMGVGAVLASAMRGTGNAVRPMIYSLFSMILNALLTPLFCYSSSGAWYSSLFLDLGIKGAALSTVVAYSLMTLLLALDFFHERQGLKKCTSSIDPLEKKLIFKRIISTSFIAALVPACTNFTIGISQSILANLSPATLDAYSLSKRFEQFLIMLAIPICAANMIIISANLGRNNYARIRESFMLSLKALLSITTILAIFMFFKSELWFACFTQKDEIFIEGAQYFKYAMLQVIFIPLCIMINFSFQGLSTPARPLPFTLGSVFLFQGIGCYFLVEHFQGSTEFYLSLGAGTFLAFICCLFLFLKDLQGLSTKKAKTEEPRL
ncbi:MATE family efflux transporter [Lentisphaera marina]|uniref:MATE family efflux transporter n=1 Tax=Lentisphaera marina TaxID=1111041 RepID=UPI002366050B|nr:MATE family efflux transporter [Lentisphaera marina]MDD7987096.1 MATE family efflux transporter [Lentisphaera marina]